MADRVARVARLLVDAAAPPLHKQVVSLLRARDPDEMLRLFTKRLETPTERIGLPFAPHFTQLRTFVQELCNPTRFQMYNEEVQSRLNASVNWIHLVELLDVQRVISDEIVNAFGALLERNTVGVAFFHSYYMSGTQAAKLDSQLGLPGASERRSHIDLSRILFFPVHLPGHWTLLVGDCKRTRFFFYNSLMGAEQSWKAVRKTRAYEGGTVTIGDNFAAIVTALQHHFPAMHWPNPGDVVVEDVQGFPQQVDAYSCALYAMHTMHLLGKRKPICISSEFALRTWDDARFHLRVHIALAIQSGNLGDLVTRQDGFNDSSEDLLADMDVEEEEMIFQCAHCMARAPGFYCRAWDLYFCRRSCQEAFANNGLDK